MALFQVEKAESDTMKSSALMEESYDNMITFLYRVLPVKDEKDLETNMTLEEDIRKSQGAYEKRSRKLLTAINSKYRDPKCLRRPPANIVLQNPQGEDENDPQRREEMLQGALQEQRTRFVPRHDLKPSTLTSEMTPNELKIFIKQSEKWCRASYAIHWEQYITGEVEALMDIPLRTKITQKMGDISKISWENLKEELERISLILHPLLKRRFQIFATQNPKELTSYYIS